MELSDFRKLEEEAFFLEFVGHHFQNGWHRASNASGSQVEIDPARIKLAFDHYSVNIHQYAVALNSKNPDHYKRSGALLHALYKAPPITVVRWNKDIERLTDGAAVGVSYADAEHWNEYTAWYELYANPLMSFDLAFRCCQTYEDKKRTYNKDFLDNMCYYMAENTSINVGSFVMIFKAFMAD